MQPFGSGPLAQPLAEALRALLAPVVLVAAIASLLLGLQRNYVGIIDTMRALNLRRREGDASARTEFALIHAWACRNARAIQFLYAAVIALLLCACATGTVLFLRIEFVHRPDNVLLVAISWAGLACFVAGILLALRALIFLLRGVSLPLRSIKENA